MQCKTVNSLDSGKPLITSSKELASENQRLNERLKVIEEKCQEECQKREDMETERNHLKQKGLSQAKDMEKMRKEISQLKKLSNKVSTIP